MAERTRRGGTVLIVDDEPYCQSVIERLVRSLGFEPVIATNGAVALRLVETHRPDVVLLDVNMPVMDGYETCRRLKTSARDRLTPVVLITGLNAVEDRVRGIEAGADEFLTKPICLAEFRARLRALMRLKHYTDALDSAEAMVLSLARTIEARDASTAGHCERLAAYAVALGQDLHLDEDSLAILRRGAILHDVGKVALPDAILLKTGPLSVSERHAMEQHPVVGDALCKDLHVLQPVRPLIRHHHERRDGSGYPDHLRGDDIPLAAQIISVVDAFDAMTTDRPYRPRLSPDAACRELRGEVERGWKAPPLVERFIRLVHERQWGTSELLAPECDPGEKESCL